VTAATQRVISAHSHMPVLGVRVLAHLGVQHHENRLALVGRLVGANAARLYHL
jgi:hypothetical protein